MPSHVDTSKLLSLVLRHRPEAIGIALDREGWVELDALVAAARAHGRALDHALVLEVVETCPKQRFALSADRLRIRACQGHSIDVDLGLSPATPPAVLHHGTARRALDAILREGLRPMSRRWVHLSVDRETARRVGARHGAPVVLRVDAAALHAAGHPFHLAENGVWLTAHVPPERLVVATP